MNSQQPDSYPFDVLTFQDSKPISGYIPTREEYIKYQQKMIEINFNSSEIRAPIAHYVAYFSRGFTSLEDVFPYAHPIMRQLGYEGEIIDDNIVWTHQSENQ
jgi:hypothetical protein